MEETSRRRRKMEASAERGQDREWAVAPWVDGWTYVALYSKRTEPSAAMLGRAKYLYTIEIHLCGLNGTASHPDVQKIQIIWIFILKSVYIGR
jgi:hypothetical protein